MSADPSLLCHTATAVPRVFVLRVSAVMVVVPVAADRSLAYDIALISIFGGASNWFLDVYSLVVIWPRPNSCLDDHRLISVFAGAEAHVGESNWREW